MKPPPNPNVLAIKTSSVYNKFGKFNGFCPKDVIAEKGDNMLTVWKDFFEHECEFISEEESHGNPRWKKVIPYFVFLNDGDALTCASKMTDPRKVARLRTIGTAGHIEDRNGATPFEAYMVGTMDVVASLLSFKLELNDINSSFIGIINDDRNGLEAGYLCLAHLITINDDERRCIKAQHGLPDAKFLRIEEMKDSLEDYDLWSSHLIQMFLRKEDITASMHDYLIELIRLCSEVSYPAACRLTSTSMAYNHVLDAEIRTKHTQIVKLLDAARNEGVI